MPYQATHVSAIDGSPAMLVRAQPFTLVNEDGYEWVDEPGGWEAIR